VKRVVVLEAAAEDIESARNFYDAEDRGIGDYCADSLLAEIERLGLFHGIHSKQFGFHRMLADRFPFGIYNLETKIEIQVFAVLDLRRNPLWIRAELSKRNA